MQRILYSTDWHLTDRQPPSRKDDYFESVSNKIRMISDLGRELEVDRIIVGGDMSHVPNESYRVFCRYLDLLKNMPVKVESLIGLTHDFSQTEKNIDKSILWALKESGVLTLHGQSHLWEIEGIKVYGAHMAITPVPFFGHYVLYKDFNIDCDIVLISHLHMPFGVTTLNNRTFISPGSLARNTCDMFNLNRKPQVAIIDIDNGAFRVNLHPLDVNTDVFDEQYILMKQSEDNTEMRSIDEIRDIVMTEETLNIESVVKSVSSKYGSDVYDTVMEIIKTNDQ